MNGPKYIEIITNHHCLLLQLNYFVWICLKSMNSENISMILAIK